MSETDKKVLIKRLREDFEQLEKVLRDEGNNSVADMVAKDSPLMGSFRMVEAFVQ